MQAAFRLAGLSEAIREAVPAAGAPLYEAVTTLGGPAFLTVGLAVVYWVAAGRRRATALVVAYGFVGFGVVVALKSGFALPRPPESVRLIAADGFGFPSGHAIGAAVVYGGIALEYGWTDDARRVAAIAGVVAAVALSRVVLGVHYLGDVLVGLAVGVLVLAGARYVVGARALGPGELERGFGLGLLAALAAVIVTGGGATAFGIAGACLGGLVAAVGFERVPTETSRRRPVVLVVVGVPLVVLARIAGPQIEGVLLGAAIDDAVLVAAVLLLPVALERLPVDRSH